MMSKPIENSRMSRNNPENTSGFEGLMQAPKQAPSGPAPAAPRSAPPQGAAPAQGQSQGGQPQPGQPMAAQDEDAPPSPDGINHMASNALMLLHDKSTRDAYEEMISTGVDGAAQAAVTIGQVTLDAFNQKGVKVSLQEKAQALEEVVDDIAEIGLGLGKLPTEPKVGGVPIGKHVLYAKTIDLWAQNYPEEAQKMAAEQQEIAASASPEDQAAAKQVAEYMQSMGQGQGQPPQSAAPPQPQPAAPVPLQ